MEKVVTKQLGAMGRIVVPEQVRKQLGLRVGAKVDIYLKDHQMVLQSHAPHCSVCGGTSTPMHKVRKAHICDDCYRIAVGGKVCAL